MILSDGVWRKRKVVILRLCGRPNSRVNYCQVIEILVDQVVRSAISPMYSL